MATFNKDEFRRNLVSLAERATTHADVEFDEHGKMIQPKKRTDRDLEHTVIVDRDGEPLAGQLALFKGDDESRLKKPRAKTRRRKQR
jgi:hypothetical protein